MKKQLKNLRKRKERAKIMGGTYWSEEVYNTRTTERKKAGSDGFDYHRLAIADASTTGEALKVHPTLDIKGVNLRESRDSAAHPESLAISVLFDVTGSMRRVPTLLQKKLATLMALLLKKGYVEHPQIMYGAIGDHFFDDCPIQIGQWESGVEQDDNLTNFILEGGGGDGLSESHGLNMYFLANHTAMDCLEKRGEKGYLFIITDEPTYNVITKEEIAKHIGDTVQANIPLAKVVEQLKEKFNVFVLIPSDTANHKDKGMIESWRDFFGQQVVFVKDPNETAETIASLIGLAEGRIDIHGVSTDLQDLGVAKRTVDNVTSAVTVYAKTGDTHVVKRTKAKMEGSLPITKGHKSKVERV